MLKLKGTLFFYCAFGVSIPVLIYAFLFCCERAVLEKRDRKVKSLARKVVGRIEWARVWKGLTIGIDIGIIVACAHNEETAVVEVVSL